MNNEFEKKLKLYKEGKLNHDEIADIEHEIDKFNAIMDYINQDDKDFIEELKVQIPINNKEEKKVNKSLKRSVNLRIIMLTAFSMISIFILIILLYFFTSNITTSLFAMKSEEAFVEREKIAQLAEMFNPQYDVTRSGNQKLLFAKQNIDVTLKNSIGNTEIDKKEIKVNYSFGKPIKSNRDLDFELIYADYFTIFNPHEDTSILGINILDETPKGTKARIFVEFSKPLTPEDIKENIINKIDSNSIELTPLVAIDSKFVIANHSYFDFRPFYPFGKDSRKHEENISAKQDKYADFDNSAHQESLIGNLNLIKNNQRLVEIMYFDDIFDSLNIDETIKKAESNGVEYIGAYITANTEDLLNLRDNKLIHGIGVQDIVIW